MPRSMLPLLLAVLVCPAVEAQTGSAPPEDFTPPAIEETEGPGSGPSPAALGDLDDSRRSLARFVPNLGRNLVGVFSPENLRPLLAGALLTASSTTFDSSTQRLLRSRASGFGHAGETAGTLSTVVPLGLGLFAAGQATADTRFRALTYDLAQSAIVTGIYTDVLKRSVGRVRPDGSNARSFPSGHTSNAFAWATVAQHHYGSRAGVPVYAAATLIGLSRIERDKHHLSDVVAGAALGLVVGRTVVREDGEPVRREKRVAIVPMADPNGAGVGAGVHVEF